MHHLKHAALALVSLCAIASSSALAADSHRVLILDIGRRPNNRSGSDHHRLLVLEIESGKVLAQAELGSNTHVALSPKGDLVAALSGYRVGGVWESRPRLKMFRASDLKLLQSGLLPTGVHTFTYQQGAAHDLQFSPDGQELIVPGAEPGFVVAHLATTVLSCVTRELDTEGFFKMSQNGARIPRCHGVAFLRLEDWPKIHIWNGNLALLEVVDLSSGKILSRLPNADDPVLDKIEPADFEKPDNEYLHFQLRGRGHVIAGGGRYAYFIPSPPHPPNSAVAYPTTKPGFVRKIDLATDPPRIILKAEEPLPDAGAVTATEAGGALVVLRYTWNPKFTHEPSHWVKVFSTSDLKLQREIELPIPDGRSLLPSRDGKYLYALDTEEAKLAVIEIASGREVKVLDRIGTCPCLMGALPERAVEE